MTTQLCYGIHLCRSVFSCRLQNVSGHLKFLVFKDVYLGGIAVQILLDDMLLEKDEIVSGSYSVLSFFRTVM